MKNNNSESALIREYITLGIFADAWSEWQDKYAEKVGIEVSDIIPEDLPESAYKVADTIIEGIEKATGKSIDVLFSEAHHADRATRGYKVGKAEKRGPTTEDFGMALAAQAMGRGEFWKVNHPDLSFEVPTVKFSYLDLPRSEYPIQD